jgi:hypothetical protein
MGPKKLPASHFSRLAGTRQGRSRPAAYCLRFSGARLVATHSAFLSVGLFPGFTWSRRSAGPAVGDGEEQRRLRSQRPGVPNGGVPRSWRKG